MALHHHHTMVKDCCVIALGLNTRCLEKARGGVGIGNDWIQGSRVLIYSRILKDLLYDLLSFLTPFLFPIFRT